MAAKRGKTQARRNSGNGGALPGWAWLAIGVVLTIAVGTFAPRFLKSSGGDGFFRPRPNPDAQPAAASGNDDAVAPEGDGQAPATPPEKSKPTQYDFYTLLPGDEVAMSDAELAATARDEAARQARAQAPTATPPAASDPAAATAPATALAVPSVGSASIATRPVADAPYVLQAGAFGAPGDAETTKAKAALLGLSARVESAAINGRTVYRVRMGPYATASELAQAKRKLVDGGLPALAIRAK